MIKPSEVVVVIPHLGGTAETEYALDECLKSLQETVPDIRVLLAINGQRCIAHRGQWDLQIKRQGQGMAVNAAVATTNTPWILVTNDDMVYAPGWFETLTRYCDRPEPEYWCTSPQLVEPRQGASTFQVYFCGGTGGDFDKQKWLEFANNKENKGGRRTGFNLPFLIKRELWDTIGGYDINFDPWGSNSDSDLEYKIKLAGVQPIQDTMTLVYHFSQISGTFHPDNQSFWQKNWDYFIEKWGFPRTDDGIWEADFTIPDPPIRGFTPKWEGKYENS